MNNINLIISILYLIVVYGGLGALGYLLQSKSKNKHFADGLIHAQTICSQLVTKYSLNPNVAKGQMKDIVAHDAQVMLDQHGYHFSNEYLMAVALKEFQHYLNNGNPFKAEPKPVSQDSLHYVNNKLNNPNQQDVQKPTQPNNPIQLTPQETQEALNEARTKKAVQLNNRK